MNQCKVIVIDNGNGLSKIPGTNKLSSKGKPDGTGKPESTGKPGGYSKTGNPGNSNKPAGGNGNNKVFAADQFHLEIIAGPDAGYHSGNVDLIHGNIRAHK